jgi:hypothetical protein
MTSPDLTARIAEVNALRVDSGVNPNRAEVLKKAEEKPS